MWLLFTHYFNLYVLLPLFKSSEKETLKLLRLFLLVHQGRFVSSFFSYSLIIIPKHRTHVLSSFSSGTGTLSTFEDATPKVSVLPFSYHYSNVWIGNSFLTRPVSGVRATQTVGCIVCVLRSFVTSERCSIILIAPETSINLAVHYRLSTFTEKYFHKVRSLYHSFLLYHC